MALRWNRTAGNVLAFLCLVLLVGAQASGDAGKVGVVDERLVCQDFLIKPWADQWKAATIADLFRKDGVEADVIGADVLKDLSKLKAYHAIMIPTDQCYPDEGSPKGPVSANIRAFVKAGGVYIMPMVAAHSHWKDIDTGKVSEDMGLQRDFLGQEWVIVADPNIPGPGEIVTDAGKKCGLQLPSFPEPFSTCTRTVNPVGVIYLLNGSERASLYMCPLGKGAVLHYAGGLPFSANVRDYVIGCYASILETGLDKESLAAASLERIATTRVYSTIPVAERTQTGPASAVRQFRLDGDWELAEARKPFSDPAETADFEWIHVTMPNSIQYALFEAGKIDNPWYADNNKKLQWISTRDWCLRKRFTIPNDWAGRRIRLRFDGIDYIGSIWLDGDFMGTHEGMLGGPTLDITEDAAPGTEHELMVRIAAGKGRSGDVIKPDILCGHELLGQQILEHGAVEIREAGRYGRRLPRGASRAHGFHLDWFREPLGAGLHHEHDGRVRGRRECDHTGPGQPRRLEARLQAEVPGRRVILGAADHAAQSPPLVAERYGRSASLSHGAIHPPRRAQRPRTRPHQHPVRHKDP